MVWSLQRRAAIDRGLVGRPSGRSFQVKLWPTLVFLRDGQEVERLVRPTDAEAIGQAVAGIDATE